MTEIPKHWGQPLGPDITRNGAVDVCVIGSGAGGAPVALTLARAGFKVLVLEKGPAYDQRDFVYDEIRSCRRDLFVPDESDEPHVQMDEHGHATKTTNGWIANCVGGGTVHFSGFTYRLHPEDLKLRSLLGSVAGSSLSDWPISWEELLPYYERAEEELGVSGDATRNPFETFRKPLPLPALSENGFATLIDATCKRIGFHAYPTARAILSQPKDGRGACERSTLCGSYGCAFGAKSSTLAAILPKALATGHCQIRPLSMAVSIDSDATGRVVAVRYLDHRGHMHRISCSIAVVACSAIETARLLLASTGTAHRDGLANQQGLVGRNLMFLGFGAAKAEFSASDPRMNAIDWREPFVNRSVQDFYLMDRKTNSIRKGGTLNFLLPHGNPILAAETVATKGEALLWGAALSKALHRRFHETKILEFEVFSETLPMPESRVTLDPEVKDRWGLPVARFKVDQHRIDRDTNRMLVLKGMDILKAMDPLQVTPTNWAQQTYWLQAGTCRFGADPKTSVLDRDCRAHVVPNLFVTDGSFMPTSGGVPNTLTIEANAFRVADRIVALGKR